jgi:ribosomal protein S11
MKLSKKNHFFFGLKTKVGLLYSKKSNSNIFLTLTDLNHRVVVCKTSGLTIKGSKRKKKAPFALEVLLKICILLFECIGFGL